MTRLRRNRHPLWVFGITTLGVFSALLMSAEVEGRALCPTGCTQACCDANTCVAEIGWSYTPGYVSNAVRGDLILDWNEGAVKTLLWSIGQTYSHMGVFVDYGRSVRHDSMTMDSLTTSSSVGFTDIVAGLFSGSSFYGKARLNPSALYHGQPGTHTGLVAEEWADGLPEWNRSNAVLVKPLNESDARTRANAFATAMTGLSHEYHLHAYTDWAGELTKNGSMCSGEVSYATQIAGVSAGYQPMAYTEPTRRQGAQTLYNAVYLAARDKISHSYVSCSCLFGGWCGAGANGQGCASDCNWPGGLLYCTVGHDVLTSGDMDALAAGVADQVVSCFIYGDTGAGCDLMTHAWASNAGGGYTMSPDDVLHQANDTYQNVAVPAQFVPGYWTSYSTGRGHCYEPIDPRSDAGVY